MRADYSDLVAETYGEVPDANQVTVLTGQTPKASENTLGSLKQLVAAYQTAEYLEEKGLDAEIVFLNADSFVEHGYPERLVRLVEGFSDNYVDQIPIENLRSSELKADGQQDRVEEVRSNVPFTSRYATEYSLEEIACIRQVSEREGGLVKIGPPHERPYDQIFSEAFPEVGFTGIYLTPTLPLRRGMNEEQIDDLRQKGGVIPYHNFGSQVVLMDSEPELEGKKEDAAPETRTDLAEVKEFLDNHGEEKPLTGHFSNLRGDESGGSMAAKSIFHHG